MQVFSAGYSPAASGSEGGGGHAALRIQESAARKLAQGAAELELRRETAYWPPLGPPPPMAPQGGAASFKDAMYPRARPRSATQRRLLLSQERFCGGGAIRLLLITELGEAGISRSLHEPGLRRFRSSLLGRHLARCKTRHLLSIAWRSAWSEH
ncbi:unnamed protein product [Arctogadus glacialis]